MFLRIYRPNFFIGLTAELRMGQVKRTDKFDAFNAQIWPHMEGQSSDCAEICGEPVLFTCPILSSAHCADQEPVWNRSLPPPVSSPWTSPSQTLSCPSP